MEKNLRVKCMSMFVILLVTMGLYGLVLAHGWRAPEEFSKMANPIKENSAAIQSGQELYTSFCSYCHGISAEGGDKLELDIQSTPPELKKRLQSHSDGDFFWKIKTGRGDMPSFEEDLEDKEVWEIISFIRSLIKQ